MFLNSNTRDMKKILIIACVICFSITSCQELEIPVNNVPTISTGDAIDISSYSATLTGTSDIYKKKAGNCYFLISPYNNLNDSVRWYTANDSSIYTTKAKNLAPNTTYYYALCASDNKSEIRGDIKSFKTSSILSIHSIEFVPWGNQKPEALPYTYDIGTFIAYARNISPYSKTITEVTANKGLASWNYPATYPADTTNLKMFAYSPYSAFGSSFTGDSNFYIYTNKYNVDYLYGSSDNLNSTNPAADIKMHHALARIVFSITRSSDDNTGNEVSSLTIRSINGDNIIPSEGVVDIMTGDISIKDYLVDTERSFDSFIPDTKTPTNVEYLSLPTSFNDGEIMLELNYGTDQLVFMTLPTSNWESGYEYDYPVTIEDSKAEIGNVHVQPWSTNNGGSLVIYN